MSSLKGHKLTGSVTQNHKAQLANAYNELGKELSSNKMRVVGNYTLGKVVGEGAYGKVRMGTHRLTSTRVAIKQIPKAMSASLTREIHHHRQLHHPHVTQMYEVIATESYIWIVTELCSGGELFDYLVEKGRLSEEETRLIFGQLCLAVAYLHERGIVHRDLKLENVLLDERCRVKLGDFGFTREYEKGSFMETFCGTTGYASPEMLEGKKYQGPEVDVWSLGIILYCLLTGTLPFDDDDEGVMRQMIIEADFEDPDWLSIESRNLIKGILQKDVSARLTIPQILSHDWFKTRKLTYEIDSQQPDSVFSSASSMMSPSASPLVTTSEFTSTPTTPDETPDDPFENSTGLHRNPSEATIRKLSLHTKVNRPETVHEEETSLPSPLPLRQNSSTFTKTPPIHPIRTPARTKRRSISSNLSDPSSPIAEKTPSPLPIHDVDFVSLLTTPAPIIFSTPVERELLNTLSMLGFDTAQIVHSVLSDACDATGALWWMLKKAERRQMEEGQDPLLTSLPSASDSPSKPLEPKVSKKRWVSTGVQTDTVATLNLARSAPQLAFVPPTPTFPRSVTPPRPTTPTRSLLVSPLDSSSKSHPSTPASSLRDKESKSRKVRSGSVSIMQRATTALEAAGLVRKKSSEVVREEKERERSKEMERKMVSGEESRSSHGSSGSSKLTKSPPLKPEKDHLPSTPPPSIHRQLPQIGSPWVFADANEGPSYSRSIPQTPANTPGDGFPQSLSTPNFSESSNSKISSAPQRNRANILKAFRLWFHEDKKGKRKETTGNGNSHIGYTRPHSTPTQPFSVGGSKRRGSIGGGFNGFGHRQRPSASSRRSSSVNSRRSSGTSVQMAVMDSPQIPNRLSFGSHTPNSERGDYPSRPSSIRSLSMPHHSHRKSPSQSSAGSNRLRTASPMRRYHRRMGSGSSTTRVVRQSSARPTHVRSNSATSSLYSPSSSRPASFYELSENEGYRSASPYKPRSRRSSDEHRRPSSSSTFIAQKRQGPFMSPGRSSWKKAWGLEPPGWQSRTAHLPVEVIAISPASEPASIRDVFSGRQSSSPGDEDEWVDEEDDVPFAGGLGQMGMVSMSTSSSTVHTDTTPPMMMLSPPSRGHWPTKLTTNTQHSRSSSSGSGSAVAARQKAGHSPVERASALPQDNIYETETRGGRRQLPASRSGPAFRQPIQEEDEDEEE
ncbi:Serine/threonine-protein kinase MARK2 [Termitomyces sp. T112]|nr:Serine/threonine-protein kinase MARK2 [Termitomyces sp. T112]